jgi:predicted porin
VDYTHDVNSRLSLIGRFSNYGYWPSRSDLSDSFQNQIGVEADYAVSSRTITYATYDHVRRDFYPGAESTFNMFGAGVRQYITKQLFADLRIGVNFINSYDERNFAKPYCSLTLTDDLDETSRVSLTVAKHYTTNNSTADLFDQWLVSGSFRKQILARLAGQADVFYGRGEYSNLRIEDNFVGASVQFDYALWHNTKANIRYSYSATNSNLDDRDYIRNYVGGGIRIEF